MRADTGSVTHLNTNAGVFLALALQKSPPVVGPGLKASLGRVRWQVFVVAGGEQDVLPGRIGLHTQDIRFVIHEDVSGHYGLVSGQDDLLQELGAEMFLYPGKLFIRTVAVMLYRTGANEDICILHRGHLLHRLHSSRKRIQVQEEVFGLPNADGLFTQVSPQVSILCGHPESSSVLQRYKRLVGKLLLVFL